MCISDKSDLTLSISNLGWSEKQKNKITKLNNAMRQYHEVFGHGFHSQLENQC